MVLTDDEYREEKSKAKSNSRQSRLFKLRNVTKSYIIQCLADREIQRDINGLVQQSKAYGYNCKVIHSPEKYANLKAVDGAGWNSTTKQPCKPRKSRYFSADTRDEQNSLQHGLNSKVIYSPHLYSSTEAADDLEWNSLIFQSIQTSFSDTVNQQMSIIRELENQLINKNKEIDYLHKTAQSYEERIINELNRKQCEIDKLREFKIQTKKNFSHFVTSCFRGILIFSFMVVKWAMFVILLLMGPLFVLEFIKAVRGVGYYPNPTAYKRVSNKGKTPSDASSNMNLRILFISAGICLIFCKKPEVIHWVFKKLVGLLRTISVYSLLSFRKFFTWSIFLVDIPLNVLATK